MISIPITEVKLFMNHLLCRSTFDAFCVPELSLSTFASFHMDGHILKDYYTKEEYETLYKDRTPIARWKQLRPVCFELIRGNHTPLSFSIVLQLSSRAVESFLSETDTSFTVSDINGLFLNLRYKDSRLNAVTGTSLNIFSMDKLPVLFVLLIIVHTFPIILQQPSFLMTALCKIV